MFRLTSGARKLALAAHVTSSVGDGRRRLFLRAGGDRSPEQAISDGSGGLPGNELNWLVRACAAQPRLAHFGGRAGPRNAVGSQQALLGY
jgi:hypothetical protein